MAGPSETRVTKVSTLGANFAGGQSCLVMIYGPDLGHRYELEGEELTIGRDIANHICIDLDNVSRRHARVFKMTDKVYAEDLGSTNGTFLNDEEVKGQVPLRSGDLVKVGGAIFKFLYGGNVESLFHEEIYRITIGDGLTQCYNKRYFMEFLEREMARGQRYGRPLSLMMFDLDHFKRVNDSHGHLAGDHVLRELAATVRGKVRKEECLARYGGEEFALVSPESGLPRVRKFAEKLRQIVADHDFSFDGKRIPVTISIGVADMNETMTDTAQFIRAADVNLYAAKKQGRNRVVG